MSLAEFKEEIAGEEIEDWLHAVMECLDRNCQVYFDEDVEHFFDSITGTYAEPRIAIVFALDSDSFINLLHRYVLGAVLYREAGRAIVSLPSHNRIVCLRASSPSLWMGMGFNVHSLLLYKVGAACPTLE